MTEKNLKKMQFRRAVVKLAKEQPEDSKIRERLLQMARDIEISVKNNGGLTLEESYLVPMNMPSLTLEDGRIKINTSSEANTLITNADPEAEQQG